MNLLSDSSSSEGEGEKDEDGDNESALSDDTTLLVVHQSIAELEGRRCLQRGPYRSTTRADSRFLDDLECCDDEEQTAAWLNDEEFLKKYRMTRSQFHKLLQVIQDDDVFQSDGRGRPQRPVAYQLLVALKALGTEGSGASNSGLRDVFSTGRGTNSTYVRRVCTALRNQRDEYITWPSTGERKAIARRIRDISGLPNCVGIIDGTLFPLSFCPQTTDSPDYKGRKHGYTLSGVIICDDNRLIRYYNMGWPGSTHDNRIFRNTRVGNNPHTYFDHNQYIIGDSAFVNKWYMVSAFTSPPGQLLHTNEHFFNRALSKARVISEHTIGILKGRFPWLRSIRKVITEDTSTLADILLFVDATIVLHNFLAKYTDDDDLEEWLEEDNDITSLPDDPNRLPDDDELNEEAHNADVGDLRRSQLMYYLLEREINMV